MILRLKQLPITDDDKAKLIEVRLEIYYDESDALAERMYTGDISLGAWEEQMKQLLRELHSSLAAIGKGGWDQMTPEDWGRLGPIMKAQYAFLHTFTGDIAANRDTMSLSMIKYRARLYGESAKQSATIVQVPIAIAKQLPWIPKDGSTTCLMNCRCFWACQIINRVGDFNIVQCVWTLSDAEHCEARDYKGKHTDGCVDRAGHAVMIRVYKDIIVPERIGGY